MPDASAHAAAWETPLFEQIVSEMPEVEQLLPPGWRFPFTGGEAVEFAEGECPFGYDPCTDPSCVAGEKAAQTTEPGEDGSHGQT